MIVKEGLSARGKPVDGRRGKGEGDKGSTLYIVMKMAQ
jgi:hypothetical protein